MLETCSAGTAFTCRLGAPPLELVEGLATEAYLGLGPAKGLPRRGVKDCRFPDAAIHQPKKANQDGGSCGREGIDTRMRRTRGAWGRCDGVPHMQSGRRRGTSMQCRAVTSSIYLTSGT